MNTSTHMKRQLNKRGIITLIIILIFAIILWRIFSGNPALDSLKSNNVSKTYNDQFWMHQAKEKTTLWFKAYKYCDTYQTPTPGCKTIESIAWGLGAYRLPSGVSL